MRSWQVLKLWGIPFKLHPYWFLLLFLFSWSIANQVNLTSGEIFSTQEALLIGFLTSFLWLCSIIIHQIFHTYICLVEGVKIKNITFLFLGAILQVERECKNALGNIKISLVRPFLCFTTCFLLLLISFLSESQEQIFINIVNRVAVLNLFLGFFYLIPMGSLDGGILFKSVVWYFSGNKNKGRSLLNKLTLIISITLLFFGTLTFFSVSSYYGLILFLIGLFGINSSKADSQFLKIENLLKYKNISELKLQPLRKIEYDLNLKELNSLVKDINQNKNKYFFITKNGRWEGFISVQILKKISVKKWQITLVNEFKQSINKFPSTFDNIPLWRIIEKLENSHEDILLVVNQLGIPKGIIDRDKIGYFVLKELGIDLSSDFIKKIKSKNKYPLGIDLPNIIELMKSRGDI